MGVLKLKPSCKDYLWGGHRLAEEYGIAYDGDVLAESWELSCHPDGPCYIVNGPFAGLTLSEYIEKQGREVLGIHCKRFRDFPVLAKFIDAKENLSIQVHPDNRYALKNEGQYGKTEMWYVMDAKEGAFLYYGFKKEISREEFEERIREDTLLEVLNAVPVHKGDVLFIESGTIHAIGKDILIAEIQQNSNVTYRVYDYGRVGKDGKKRDLHIEKALAVTNRVPIMKSGKCYPHVADCDYFTVDKLNLDGRMMESVKGTVTDESFVSILVLDGRGSLTCDGETIDYKKGDSLFLTAGSGDYEITGRCDALVTTVREKSGPVRIGVDIGGTNTKIGLVDINQKFLAEESFPTLSERGPEDLVERIAGTVTKLLEERQISLDQCVGLGVGVPGTIDRRRGMVVYSNNIVWDHVPLQEMLSQRFPIPVKIANDADCAALGEVVAGTAKDYQDAILLTLGTGVGGGIILDGRIFESKAIGGSEVGHMVIVEGGESCTCGRRGCLEAYASATGLKKAARNAFGRDVSPEELFRLAGEKDRTAQKVVDDYIRRLGIGVVNLVNIFRPQIVLLGGGVCAQGETLLTPIWEMMRKECFGGEYGELPELAIAGLGSRAGVIGAASLL